MSKASPLLGLSPLLLTIALALCSCSGGVWPSHSMTIDMAAAQASPLEVAGLVEQIAVSRGFVRIGSGGHDTLMGSTGTLGFSGPDDMTLDLGVDRQAYVRIRVSQNRETLSPEADNFFEELVVALSTRWPDSVTRETRGEQ